MLDLAYHSFALPFLTKQSPNSNSSPFLCSTTSPVHRLIRMQELTINSLCGSRLTRVHNIPLPRSGSHRFPSVSSSSRHTTRATTSHFSPSTLQSLCWSSFPNYLSYIVYDSRSSHHLIATLPMGSTARIPADRTPLQSRSPTVGAEVLTRPQYLCGR